MIKNNIKSKVLFSVLAIAMFVAFSGAAQATGCDTTITLSGQPICVKVLTYTSFGYTYYTVLLPSQTRGDVPFTLGVLDFGVMNTAQIQAKASLYWGSLTLPLP